MGSIDKKFPKLNQLPHTFFSVFPFLPFSVLVRHDYLHHRHICLAFSSDQIYPRWVSGTCFLNISIFSWMMETYYDVCGFYLIVCVGHSFLFHDHDLVLYPSFMYTKNGIKFFENKFWFQIQTWQQGFLDKICPCYGAKFLTSALDTKRSLSFSNILSFICSIKNITTEILSKRTKITCGPSITSTKSASNQRKLQTL